MGDELGIRGNGSVTDARGTAGCLQAGFEPFRTNSWTGRRFYGRNIIGSDNSTANTTYDHTYFVYGEYVDDHERDATTGNPVINRNNNADNRCRHGADRAGRHVPRHAHRLRGDHGHTSTTAHTTPSSCVGIFDGERSPTAR